MSSVPIPMSSSMSVGTTATSSSAASMDDYRMVGSLGRGAYGRVYSAVNKLSGQTVAVKVVDKKDVPAMREAEICRELSGHEHIANIISAVDTRKKLYLLYEYYDGGELYDAIRPDYGVCEKRTRRYFNQLCDALAHCHDRGFRHGDVKPENICLDKYDNVKLVDWGAAAVYDAPIPCGTGTVPYMAPELFDNCNSGRVDDEGNLLYEPPLEGLDGRAIDVFALGVTLFTLIFGTLPFGRTACVDSRKYQKMCSRLGATFPWKHDRCLSPRLIELFHRMLARDPDDRCTIADIGDYLNDQWFLYEEDHGHSDDINDLLDLEMDMMLLPSEHSTVNVLETSSDDDSDASRDLLAYGSRRTSYQEDAAIVISVAADNGDFFVRPSDIDDEYLLNDLNEMKINEDDSGKSNSDSDRDIDDDSASEDEEIIFDDDADGVGHGVDIVFLDDTNENDVPTKNTPKTSLLKENGDRKLREMGQLVVFHAVLNLRVTLRDSPLSFPIASVESGDDLGKKAVNRAVGCVS